MEIPPLHLITSDEVLQRRDFPSLAAELLMHGGSRVAIHLRTRRQGGAELLQLCRSLGGEARAVGAWLVVSDRLDVALAGGADAVQLGSGSFTPAEARAIAGRRLRIGASVHGYDEGWAAARQGVDYLIAGTLYPTASHPGRRGSGVEWLRELASLTPTVGIGGVTPDRVPETRATGAAGIAVLGGVWNAPDPVRALRSYLRAWEGKEP